MLVFNDRKYLTDHEKAEIFSKNLQKTFSPAQESNFDEYFKTIVDERVKNHDFSKHNYKTKDLFDMKDLNKAIKLLKRNSAPGEDMINNSMLQNTTSEFRKMILKLINLTVKQSKIPQEWKESIITMLPKKIKVVIIRKTIVPSALLVV